TDRTPRPPGAPVHPRQGRRTLGRQARVLRRRRPRLRRLGFFVHEPHERALPEMPRSGTFQGRPRKTRKEHGRTSELSVLFPCFPWLQMTELPLRGISEASPFVWFVDESNRPPPKPQRLVT